MISINNVSVLFGDYALLDSISFLVNKRDRIGLTGRNGAGKSTLLKILAGVQEPSEGSICSFRIENRVFATDESVCRR